MGRKVPKKGAAMKRFVLVLTAILGMGAGTWAAEQATSSVEDRLRAAEARIEELERQVAQLTAERDLLLKQLAQAREAKLAAAKKAAPTPAATAPVAPGFSDHDAGRNFRIVGLKVERGGGFIILSGKVQSAWIQNSRPIFRIRFYDDKGALVDTTKFSPGEIGMKGARAFSLCLRGAAIMAAAGCRFECLDHGVEPIQVGPSGGFNPYIFR